MYQILVLWRGEERPRLFTTDNQDVADCRMAEFRRDPRVLQAWWVHLLQALPE